MGWVARLDSLNDLGGGTPLDNLRVTLFNVMGLSSTDCQTAGQAGFGLCSGPSMS